MTDLTAPRVYVTTDPNAEIRAIANTSTPKSLIGLEGTYYPTFASMLALSRDGATFYTGFYQSSLSGGDQFEGKITQPQLGIDDKSIKYSDGTMAYDGVEYILDETATVAEIITKPIMRMRVRSVVETSLGYYVTAENRLDRHSYFYLDGKPLTIIPDGSMRVRETQDDLVECMRFVGHEYLVRGDHMDTSRQTATFDGKPATEVPTTDYNYQFADDLSTVTVTKK
jgi:hypothetical protein